MQCVVVVAVCWVSFLPLGMGSRIESRFSFATREMTHAHIYTEEGRERGAGKEAGEVLSDVYIKAVTWTAGTRIGKN